MEGAAAGSTPDPAQAPASGAAPPQSAPADSPQQQTQPRPEQQQPGQGEVGQNREQQQAELVEADTVPSSFAEIMQMMQDGKKPPGIRQIENRLSEDADSPSVSTMAPMRKPWE